MIKLITSFLLLCVAFSAATFKEVSMFTPDIIMPNDRFSNAAIVFQNPNDVYIAAAYDSMGGNHINLHKYRFI